MPSTWRRTRLAVGLLFFHVSLPPLAMLPALLISLILAVPVAAAAMALGALVWRAGLAKYESTGS